MTEKSYEIASIADIEEGERGGWSPIRKHFGVESFGINAWTAHEAGGTVIPEHDEVPSGHEEIYVVMSGHAAFTVDGDEVDAPQGSVVFVRDPAVKRGATAREGGTTVLTAGAEPGAVYEPRAWEINAQIPALFDKGELEKAKKVLTDALPRYKDKAGILYNIACTEALLGEADEALGHLREALAAQPSYVESARDDPDFESLRSDPRFAELVGA
jgi:quercetin dioxygenase-like cupin family protein